MSSQTFQELYQKLNPKQKEAVDMLSGPVIVLAGPGTGKTQILTLRIANILLKTDTAPGSILALTFTEAASAHMRRRLFEIIGAPAYRVRISTFHAFCNDLIQSYPESFPRIIGSKHITDADQFKMLCHVITTLPLTLLRPHGDGLYYVHSISRVIGDLKRDGVDVDEFVRRVENQEKEFLGIEDLYHTKGVHEGKMKSEYKTLQKSIEKNKELGLIYVQYEKILREERRYDYNDMIMETVRVLRNDHDLLLALQERYEYLLADEHQDVNDAQNALLELLVSHDKNPNIFIVGDDKQAIFRFQGASLQNFYYFLKQYPRAKAIALEENYRSTQTILDASHSLIQNTSELLPEVHRELRATSGAPDIKIQIHVCKTKDDERYVLAQDIKRRIAEGVEQSEIVVLYRDNKDVIPVAHIFEKVGIPFSVQSDQNVLEDSDIKNLITLFKTIHYFGEDEWLLKALHFPYLGIHPFDVYRLLQYAHSSRYSLYSVLNTLPGEEVVKLESREALLHFYDLLVHSKRDSSHKGANEMFEMVARESGFLGHILNRPDAAKKLERVMIFFREVERLVEGGDGVMLSDLVEYLDLIIEHNIVIKGNTDDTRLTGVRLMTAHKAKGLEFDYVYIINATDGHWGNRTTREHFKLPLGVGALERSDEALKGNDDERRLFYVALTRARREVVVSYAKHDERGGEVLPSQFLSEIDDEYKEEKDCTDLSPQTSSEKASLFALRSITTKSVYDKDFVRNLFETRGISATGLNHYLECPWKYFYADLLRIPQAKTKPLMYGTAAHGAMHVLFERLKEGKEVSVDQFLESFTLFLEREPLTPRMFDDLLKKGKESLRGYFEYYNGMWNTNVLSEFRVDGAELMMQGEIPHIRLVGRIDKIELGVGDEVNVVDYKTSKPMSRNQIEGLTKDANGDYKRQLVFYKLLLSQYVGGRYHVVSGEIDFLEPNERGTYKKEKFNLIEEDVITLREAITTMAQEVWNLSFWEKRCDDKGCEYCALRNNF